MQCHYAQRGACGPGRPGIRWNIQSSSRPRSARAWIPKKYISAISLCPAPGKSECNITMPRETGWIPGKIKKDDTHSQKKLVQYHYASRGWLRMRVQYHKRSMHAQRLQISKKEIPSVSLYSDIALSSAVTGKLYIFLSSTKS